MRAYKVEIRPNEEQRIKIHKTFGVIRFIYNFYISHNKEIYEREKRFVSGYDFSKWLNNDFIPNKPEYSWIKEVSSKAVKQSILNGDKAFKKFFDKKASFPRFKKRMDRVKVYLPKNNKTDWTIERHRVKIPTFGWVRFKEFGYIPTNAKVKSGTVSRIANKYYVSILVEEEFKTKSNNHEEPIGVDLGVKEFAITSKGEYFKNVNKTPKVKKLEKKLKKEQRSLSRKSLKKNKERRTNNLEKNKLRVQKLHMKLSNIRKEYVRFVVNSLVKQSPQFIAIEDLNTSGMMKNRNLSKAISQQNFYYFKQFLIQQCSKNRIEVRVIDRWYPSSKLCRKCGGIKQDLKLSDRVYECGCGHTEDRDLNASINIRECKTYKIAN